MNVNETIGKLETLARWYSGSGARIVVEEAITLIEKQQSEIEELAVAYTNSQKEIARLKKKGGQKDEC